MNHTKIEWVKNPDGTQGYTWNPITGCLNGCSYCYARKLANTRLRERYLGNTNWAPITGTHLLPNLGFVEMNPFYPRFWKERLEEPKRGYHYTDRYGGCDFGAREKGIFVCDMSDVFGIGIPKEWTHQIMEVIRSNTIDRFYLLTKQPQNLAKFSPFPENCWVGVTATDQDMFDNAIHYLSEIKASIKYISFEPLLEWQLDIVDLLAQSFTKVGIQWVIIGSQTKPYHPPELAWVKDIVRAADKAGVKVFLKDNLQPLFKPLMRVPNLSWYGNVFGLRQEMP